MHNIIMGLSRVKTQIYIIYILYNSINLSLHFIHNYATTVRFELRIRKYTELVPRGSKGDPEAFARERTGYRAPPSTCSACAGCTMVYQGRGCCEK